VKEDIHPIAIQSWASWRARRARQQRVGLGPAPLKLLADTDCEELERALATNVLGPFR